MVRPRGDPPVVPPDPAPASAPVPQRVVTAVAVSVNSDTLDVDQQARIEAAMTAAILACTAEGISTEEANASIIKARMFEAHDRVVAEIAAERLAHRAPVSDG